MTQQIISDWNGASGGSRDNYPELLAKCKNNFEELYDGSWKMGRNVSFSTDFLGPVIPPELTLTAGSDSPVGGAITVAAGGKYRLTTGDSGASVAADGVQITTSLNWKASLGGLYGAALLSISAIAAVRCFVGFTDTVALEAPATLTTTTITTVADDCVGFLFDTGATTDTIRLVGSAATVDATAQDTANAWAAATATLFEVFVTSAGVATFFIDGTQVGTAMTAALTAATAVAFTVYVQSLTTNSKTLDIDALAVGMNRY